MSYWNRVDARTAMTVLGLLVGSSVAAGQPAIDHFEKNGRPLLIEKCISCHGPEKQKSGLRLDSRPALLTGGERPGGQSQQAGRKPAVAYPGP